MSSEPVQAPPVVDQAVPAPAPAKRGRKKAEGDAAPKPSAKASKAAEPKPAAKPAALAAAKPSAKQLFLEQLLDLHCALAETAQIIDSHWGKQLAKISPYLEGPEGEGDEDPIDEE